MEHNHQLRSMISSLADVPVAALLALGAAFERRPGRRRDGSAVLTAVPIVLVNVVAFYGQFAYLSVHLDAPQAIRVIMAIALESIAIYLAYQAHLALVADDSALRLRLGAYSVALLIATLNYSHWMNPGWRPTFTAVAFALCSAISPALWSVHSRRSSRDRLKARGLIEDHAVRLGATRWFWHLIGSVHVMYRATWIGENRPAEAVKLRRSRAERRENRKALDQAASRGQDGDVAGASRDRRSGSGETVAPAAAVEKPPSAPHSRKREPQPARPVRAARAAELAAASDRERQLALRLTASGQELPSVRELSRAEFGNERCQAAYRVLRLARAGMNGASRDDANGS